MHLVGPADLIRTSICDKYSGSMKITTHLDDICHGQYSPVTNWLKRWTNQIFIVNTRRDYIIEKHSPWGS